MRIRSYLDRFVHPWVAAIATTGALLWIAAFLVAATGLAVRPFYTLLFIDLFAIAGYLGLAGMLTIAACAVWLGVVRAMQIARALSASDPRNE